MVLGMVVSMPVAHGQTGEPHEGGGQWAEPGASSGEAPAEAAPAPITQPPDIVQLADGGMLRGTIVELVPKSHVIVMTVSGEQRRIDIGSVVYAGPSEGYRPEGSPSDAVAESSPPEAGSTAPTSRVKLTSSPPGVVFRTRTETQRISHPLMLGRFTVESSEPLCTAPCEVDMADGTYPLILEYDRRRARATEAVVIRGDTTLHGTYESRRTLRIIGWTLLGVSIAGSATLMVLADERCERSEPGCGVRGRRMNPVLGWSAVGVAVAGSTAGLIMGLQKDRAVIQVSPAGGAPAERRESAGALGTLERLGLQGMKVGVGGTL